MRVTYSLRIKLTPLSNMPNAFPGFGGAARSKRGRARGVFDHLSARASLTHEVRGEAPRTGW